MNFTNYLKEVKNEMTHVSFPSRKQTISFTVLVIIVSLFVAFYLGFLDYILNLGIKSIFGF